MHDSIENAILIPILLILVNHSLATKWQNSPPNFRKTFLFWPNFIFVFHEAYKFSVSLVRKLKSGEEKRGNFLKGYVWRVKSVFDKMKNFPVNSKFSINQELKTKLLKVTIQWIISPLNSWCLLFKFLFVFEKYAWINTSLTIFYVKCCEIKLKIKVKVKNIEISRVWVILMHRFWMRN